MNMNGSSVYEWLREFFQLHILNTLSYKLCPRRNATKQQQQKPSKYW